MKNQVKQKIKRMISDEERKLSSDPIKKYWDRRQEKRRTFPIK